jgi:aspartate-semialdehyde dehydrogenase
MVEHLMLHEHPWFRLGHVVGSDASAGQLLRSHWMRKEAVLAKNFGDSWWQRPFPRSAALADKTIMSFAAFCECTDPREDGDDEVHFVFSAISPSYEGLKKERALAALGFKVFSVSPDGRTGYPDIPLVMADVNGCKLAHPVRRAYENAQGGILVKCTNCCTTGLAPVMRALHDAFGVTQAVITTWQSMSGRGDRQYAPPERVVHNIYPTGNTPECMADHIKAELASVVYGEVRLTPSRCAISVQTTRVPVQFGHLINLRCRTETAPGSAHRVLEALRQFRPPAPVVGLPSYGSHEGPIVVEPGPVQPTWFYDDDLCAGIFSRAPKWAQDPARSMQVVVGDVSTDDDVFDISLNLCVDNVMRGALLGALLNMELYLRYEDGEAT